MPVPASTKARIQREALLVSQYVAETFAGARALFQVRVGPLPDRALNATLTIGEKIQLGNFRRSADAVVILPDKIVLIEGYIHVQLGKLSQLMTYLELLPLTPELKDFGPLPVSPMLLGAQRDPILDQMAAKFNIPVVIFQPAWVITYLAAESSRHARTRENVNLTRNGA
jgi:hypothetical protein